jgi:hypothetical protein
VAVARRCWQLLRSWAPLLQDLHLLAADDSAAGGEDEAGGYWWGMLQHYTQVGDTDRAGPVIVVVVLLSAGRARACNIRSQHVQLCQACIGSLADIQNVLQSQAAHVASGPVTCSVLPVIIH